MNQNVNQLKSRFHELMKSFANGQIVASDFERQYIKLWNDYVDSDVPQQIGSPIDQIISSLFVEVDAFCAEPDLRDELDIDETELLAAVQGALNELDCER